MLRRKALKHKIAVPAFIVFISAFISQTMASIVVLNEPKLSESHIRINRGHGTDKGKGGGGSSGAIYFCGYIGGREGNSGWERHIMPVLPRGGKENSHGGEKEISPSPEIIKNEIIPNNYYEDDDDEEYYDNHPHSHPHSSGCKGWKIIHHPMSKMYPFKYTHSASSKHHKHSRRHSFKFPDHHNNY